MKKGFLSILLTCGFAYSLMAQDQRTATLVGTVTDSAGAAVPNATVDVTNVDTNVVTHTKTNGDGAYYAPFLLVGNYKLEVESAGFKKYERTGLIFNAGETPRVDVQASNWIGF